MTQYALRLARQAGLALLFLAAAILGIVSGVLFAYAGDLPQISALDDYTPSTITRVYGSEGGMIGDFALERRVLVSYDDIPEQLQQAILAAEDARFFQHFGISVPRIIVTAVTDVIRRRMHGASTLTQQLTRKLFLTDEKTWERKIKEVILTIQVEKRYTKREIFTMYCNQMYFGHGAYGVEAAARLYFGKPVARLNLDEAALIAGILQGNVRQSPYVNMTAALRRRNYALDRMATVGYITREDARAAMERPIVLAGEQPGQRSSVAPYYVEEVRKHLEARYGAKQLYENGLAVHTTLDVALQEAASRTMDEGLRRLDKLAGFRSPARNVADEGRDIEAFRHPRWDRPMAPGDVVPALVTRAEAARIHLRVGRHRGTIDAAGFAWTGRRAATALVRPGDLVEARIVRMDEAAGTVAATLEQAPAIEGALLAIENRTGRILAMVGGYSFERSKFNRAVQAYRQVGSAFKPIVYTAAIDRGFTPSSLIMDTPASFAVGPGQPLYEPANYDRQFEGAITLRRALEQSRNVPAVRMMEQLGPEQVVAYARRMGLTSPIPPYLAVALGAAEATLLEMTSAYSVYPNQGVRMRPHLITTVSDREGNVLEENRPEPTDAIRADTAFVLTNLLRGVVQRGTAARAASLGWPLGGKTGTTDEYTDAWFIGFDPDITVGVWVGYDQKRQIGRGQTGTVAALPIWMDFMKAYIGGRDDRPEFPAPGNIVFVQVDRGTGTPAGPGEPGAITEAFIAGTQPGSVFPR